MNLRDSYASIILPGIFNPLGVFWIRQYLKGFPQECIEAAESSGASEWKVFRYIIKLPEDKIKEQPIKKYIGKEVVIGIRPENVFVDNSSVSGSSADTITCHVDVAEVMGTDSFLHLTCGSNLIIARTSSHTDICPGDIIKVQMDGNQIHIFDKETGKAIL